MGFPVAVVLMGSLAVLGIVEVALFRFGYLQKWPRRYFEATDAPNSVRNGIFAVLPCSLSVLCLFLVLAAAQLPWGAGYFVLLDLFLALGFFVLGFWWISHPPEFLKPDWMRAAESAVRIGAADKSVPSRRLIEVSPLYYRLSWVALSLTATLALIFLGPVTLIGVGVGIPYLVAMRPRPPRTERTWSRGESNL